MNWRMIDRELAESAIDFMQRSVTAHNPFFAYIPYTQLHFPTLPEPAFQGKPETTILADVLVQMDDGAGRLLDAIDRMGVRITTIFIFPSDNAFPKCSNRTIIVGFQRAVAGHLLHGHGGLSPSTVAHAL